jgi:hypothetical protein
VQQGLHSGDSVSWVDSTRFGKGIGHFTLAYLVLSERRQDGAQIDKPIKERLCVKSFDWFVVKTRKQSTPIKKQGILIEFGSELDLIC